MTVKLLQPVFDGGQRLETLTLTGDAFFPVSVFADRREVDTVAVMSIIAARANVSLSAACKLQPADLAVIMHWLFAPKGKK